MRCPICDVTMKEVERRSVRIDVCPECRGTWLDRGELEKLIGREQEYWGEGRFPGYDRDDREPGRPQHRKKRGFLQDMFDIFD